jgi:endonuclease G
MATANLTKKADLRQMERLGDNVRRVLVSLEKAGRESTTGSEAFANRNGYDDNFLDGWKIPMPIPKGSGMDDIRHLRRGGTGFELKYRNFSVIMSASRRMPILTAVNINGETSENIRRTNIPWNFDGRLDEEDQWGDAIYDNNILDRGHMVRREDPNWGENASQANRDTFHFTNSCPQVAGVNQRIWLGLENYVLQNTRTDSMLVNVFTGPFFRDDDLEYKGAKIPAAFWKVVAIVTEDGRPSATAYKVSQEKELGELEFVFSAYKTFQVSILEVMEGTGIDFTALVPYDGFSTEEVASGTRQQQKLESLENIRI